MQHVFRVYETNQQLYKSPAPTGPLMLCCAAVRMNTQMEEDIATKAKATQATEKVYQAVKKTRRKDAKMYVPLYSKQQHAGQRAKQKGKVG